MSFRAKPKLTQLRRHVYGQATTDLKKQVRKGTRWLLLNNPENLDPVKVEPDDYAKPCG